MTPSRHTSAGGQLDDGHLTDSRGIDQGDPRVIAALEQYLSFIEKGERPDRAAFLADHPQIASVLSCCLDGLDFVQGVAPHLDPALVKGAEAAEGECIPATPLGDFRLVREIGRGGMGVVYEAEQLSLSRRVALKVLPFASMLHQRHLQRFKNEAQAAALLKHANIVSVHGVGCERGVHYYAMELIEGWSLAEVIDHLRHRDVITGDTDEGAQPTAPSADTAPVASLSTDYSRGSREYSRSVARLGTQAAEALEYAHREGIVHRDIKPSNLMLDARGKLWITDFGLAQVQGDHNLTMTGDLVGTLRYMSPEQASGRTLLDHRTDIYSLGATLYELLTLCPAFAGEQRQELLRQVTECEPRPPRKIDHAIPRDLETIVLKSISKEPEGRYSTAAELGDDLQRFLEQKPVHARRTGRTHQVWRWSKRNPLAAGMLSIIGCLALLLAIGGPLTATRNAILRQKADVARDEAETARDEMEQFLYVSDISVAHQALDLGNVERALQLLEKYRPRDGKNDLRGFEWHYLMRKCKQSTNAIAIDLPRPSWKYGGNVRSLAFSPDGRFIAAAMWANNVTLWSAKGREIVRHLPTNGKLRSVTFSPDGMTLLAGAENGPIHVWDMQTYEPAQLDGHSDEVVSLAFSGDGLWLASASRDETVKVWRRDTADDALGFKHTHTLTHDGRVHSVAFLPGGDVLATGNMSGAISLWNPRSGAAMSSRVVHGAAVRTVAVSPDGGLLASGGADHLVKLLTPDLRECVGTFVAHTATVSSVAFSPDGTTLASADKNGRIIVWDVAAREAFTTITGHSGPVTCLAFSPDGNWLASGGHDLTVRLWSLDSIAINSPAPVVRRGCVWDLEISPDGKKMAFGGSGLLRLWGLDAPHRSAALLGHRETVFDVAFSPDSRLLASGGGTSEWGWSRPVTQDDRKDYYGLIKLWSADSGQELATISGHSAMVTAVEFFPDGKALISGSLDGTAKIWDVRTHQLVVTLRRERLAITAAALAPNAETLALASEKSVIELWNMEEGSFRFDKVLLGHEDWIPSIDFSPDEMLIASASLDGTARIWDRTTGQLVHELRGHGSWVFDVAFSPDGKTLATASTDHTVKLWNLATGAELMTLKGHKSWALALAFSPDGGLLASGSVSPDRTILLWRAK